VAGGLFVAAEGLRAVGEVYDSSLIFILLFVGEE
jgi:hypothetical protein